jgi:hypothetical protein
MYNKEDINKIISYFGLEFQDIGNAYVLPTYCHNPDGTGSKKLFVYFNEDSVILRCYTNCGTMTLESFVEKYQGCNYFDAKRLIDEILDRSIDGFDNLYKEEELELPFARKKKKTYKVNKVANNFILNSFYHVPYGGWIEENISHRTQEKFNIRFDIVHNAIIIPQLNENGQLVGIRRRALNESDIEYKGKYKPIFANDRWYNADTSTILYGLFENRENIIKSKKAIVFEAEKSVLQLDTFYNGTAPAVALYGSNMSDYQADLLRKLGAEELIVALDKEYQNEHEYRTYLKVIVKKFQKFQTFFTVTFVLDGFNSSLLDYKDSPSDHGKETFEKLLRRRIIL